MGFKNRLQLVRDETAPIERRIMALCDALTHCHVGFNEGKRELENKFAIRIGEPITNKQLLFACEYLEYEWEQHGRKSTCSAKSNGT